MEKTLNNQHLNPRIWNSIGWSLILLVASIFMSYIAGILATNYASNPVTDILLSNLPYVDLADLFAYGALVSTAALTIVLARRLRWAPFVIKSIATFIVIRSIFVIMTHVGPFPQFPTSNNPLEKFFIGADFFFSGHTGLPFLVALIFWNFKKLRIGALSISIIFAVSALLSRLHYSIDVFAAYFITFAIFHICMRLWEKDYEMFLAA